MQGKDTNIQLAVRGIGAKAMGVYTFPRPKIASKSNWMMATMIAKTAAHQKLIPFGFCCEHSA